MSNSTNGTGGYQPPNYTQIPNAFLDLQLPKIKSLAELKVVLTVMRQTFGWHKEEDQLSITQIQERTGLSRQSSFDGVKEALKHRLIKRRKVGNTYLYRVNVKNLDFPTPSAEEASVLDSRTEGVQNLERQVVKNLDPQKKGTKESKETLRGQEDKPPERTRSQELADDFYNRLKGRYRITLEKHQYGYHLGKFSKMLKTGEVSDNEVLRVIAHMVEVFPKSPKVDAVIALQDVRLGRDTGEAWQGEAPWEKAKRESEPDPYKNLRNFTGVASKNPVRKQSPEEIQEVIKRIERERKEATERLKQERQNA